MRREKANIMFLRLLVVLAGLFLFSLLPERSGIRLFTNSDALYMPSLYQDLFVHHSGLYVWHLNGAPDFFPDMLLFFPLMALLKSTTLTIMVYGLVQMFLILYLMDRFLGLADRQISQIARYLVLLSFLLFPLSAVLDEGYLIPSQLLLSGYHAGYFFNSLLAAILALSYLKSGSRRKLLILGLLSFVAIISDKLFIMGFVGPGILFSLLQLFQKGRNKRYLVLIAVLGPITLLALFTFRMMGFLGAIDMISTSKQMFQFEQIPEAMVNFLHHMTSVIKDYPIQRIFVIATLLFILGATLYLIIYLRRYLSRRLDPRQECAYAVVLYLFLFVTLILFTPIINGYYLNRSLIRYNYSALVMGTSGFIYLASVLLSGFISPSWFRQYFTTAASTVLLILFLVLGVKHYVPGGLQNYLNYYPDKARILDELKSKHGLSYGLGGYWQAKYSTMFSRNDLRLYSVSNGSFRPSYRSTNENWFHDGGKGSHANPTFNFLETSAFSDTGKLMELFGENMDTLYHDEDLLVIKVPDFKIDRESREIYLLGN